jgi:hypothetical protein
MHHSAIIVKAIDESPLNCGLRGADWIAEPGNIAIVEGHDVILFDRDSDGIFEIHVLLASRGKAAVERIKNALGTMFRDRGAEVIFGLVPEHRRDVAVMARWCKLKFIKNISWLGDRVELFQITKEQWTVQ